MILKCHAMLYELHFISHRNKFTNMKYFGNDIAMQTKTVDGWKSSYRIFL